MTAANLSFTSSFFNIIAGHPRDTSTHRQGTNPSTLAKNPDVPISSAQDLDDAVNSARQAFKSWANVPIAERRAAVLKYADALESLTSEFAELLVKENGKPLAQAKYEIFTTLTMMRTVCAIDIDEEIIEQNAEKKTVIRYTPLGVVFGIVPWNYPIVLTLGKVAPSLLMGCPIIVKPSPFTPYTTLKLAELAQQFFPPGVVQALSDDGSLGALGTLHPGIDKISFTGSIATGKLVAASAAKSLKRVTLELGGNDAAIVREDIDIEKVAPVIATISLLNAGQLCVTMKRIYIHASIFEPFFKAYTAAIAAMKVGDGLEPGTQVGPIQNSMQFGIVQGHLEDIKKNGYSWTTPHAENTLSSPEQGKGYFIAPTIVKNPPADSRIVIEEPFGPIVPLLSYDDIEDAIEAANDSNTGLGASVWTKDLVKGEEIARKLQAGSVWVNNHFDVNFKAPFGGIKESGLGVEWGIQGMRSFCNTSTLYVSKAPE